MNDDAKGQAPEDIAGLVKRLQVTNLELQGEIEETKAALREAEDKLAKAEATVAGMVKWLEENQVDVFRRGIYEAADAARQAKKGVSE